MDNENEILAKESLEEAEPIKNGEFEGEIWLSTDGKHTVRMKAETLEGRSAGSKWAKATYEAIVKRFGTKQAQAVREYKKPEEPIEEAVEKVREMAKPVCPKCGSEMIRRTAKKTGNQFWGCSKYPNCNGLIDSKK